MEEERNDLKSILTKNIKGESINNQQPQKQLRPSEWVEIRLFLSSTFIDTHSERDLLVKRIIPDLNRQLKDSCITIVPVDLRWGVFGEQSKDCFAIQRTCLNEIDNCRQNKKTYPYFIGLRTQRYGWVQNALLNKDGFENPQLFGWIETLMEHEKELSITSLECLHAVWHSEEMTPIPTVFFYEREITNAKDIEDKFKWIYEMEYQMEDKGCQYTKTPKASIYAEDKKKLNEYLMSLSHVKYAKYKCWYEKGGARITGNDGKKDFGIGNVEGLDDFGNMVREDLLGGIQKNFKKADVSTLSELELSNMQYEEAIEKKALQFIERPVHTEKIMEHCTAKKVDSSVLIVAGKPGRGKSALVAYAANKCVKELRPNKAFVFVHGVDTCPQSNDLEQMLLRLHSSMCMHVGKENNLKTSDDLKDNHVKQLEEIALNHPDKMFIIFVDAVNQLHEGMQAWSMWWLPGDNSPINLRVVVSTLLKENKTFANALKHCTNAKVVKVKNMTKDESKGMVSTILKKYNKRLTTDDSDAFLKNQMDLLISKNTSPLYLSVACEALRTEGVFEEMTGYIENLPETVPALFSSLLEGWSDDYGSDFIKYLMCIITLSRDGLLENMISGILIYIEDRKEVEFTCSFSTVFSAIRGFLSSGGGGYLHFFHDQVNMVVREKYLKPSPTFEAEEVHDLLAGFYWQQIRPQLTAKSTSLPPSYYESCLRHVLYHQNAARIKNEQKRDFSYSLRNIFYVREKIKAKQETSLQKEYLSAVAHTTDKTSLTALGDWKKFVSIYRPFIEELPDLSYNTAVNQTTSSYVYKDTKKLNVKVKHDKLFPTYWVNKPSHEQDHVLLKYMSGQSEICATTTTERNMVAVSGGSGGDLMFAYKMTTSELITQSQTELDIVITFLTFSKDSKVLWVGDSTGCIHILDIISGKMVWSSERIGEDENNKVVWLEHVNDTLICGTWPGTVASLCTTTRTITNTWRTGEDTFVCHYHHTSDILCTGHDKSVKYWKLNGELVRSLDVEGERLVIVFGLDIHPAEEHLVACGINDYHKGNDCKVVQLNILNGEVIWEVKGRSLNCHDVVYTHDGERLVYVDKDQKTLIMLDGEGNVTNKVKGHVDRIRNIRLVPGTNQLLTAGRDGSFLFNLPTTPDQQHKDDDNQYKVISCAVVSNRNEIIVLKTNEAGKCIVERCHGDSLETLASIEVEGEATMYYSGVLPHPTNDNLVVMRTRKALLFLDTASLEVIAKHSVLSEDEVNYICDFTICKDGTRCVVALRDFGTSVVYDITNVHVITTLATFKMKYMIQSSDINTDGTRVVFGSYKGIVLYDVATSQPIKTLSEERIWFVRFVYQPVGVMFVEDYNVHLMSLDGVVTHSFPGEYYSHSPTLLNSQYMVTGNEEDSTIQMHDMSTGKTVYKFYHPLSEGFEKFAYQPEHNKLFAVNNNGKLYMLKGRYYDAKRFYRSKIWHLDAYLFIQTSNTVRNGLISTASSGDVTAITIS